MNNLNNIHLSQRDTKSEQSFAVDPKIPEQEPEPKPEPKPEPEIQSPSREIPEIEAPPTPKITPPKGLI